MGISLLTPPLISLETSHPTMNGWLWGIIAERTRPGLVHHTKPGRSERPSLFGFCKNLPIYITITLYFKALSRAHLMWSSQDPVGQGQCHHFSWEKLGSKYDVPSLGPWSSCALFPQHLLRIGSESTQLKASEHAFFPLSTLSSHGQWREGGQL